MKFGYVLLVCLLYPLSLLISTARWKLLLPLKNNQVSYIMLFVIYWKSSVYGQILPTSYGGDLVRFGSLKKSLPKSELFNSIFLDRLSGLVALIISAAIASLFGYHLISQVLELWLVVLIILISGLGIFTLPQIINLFYGLGQKNSASKIENLWTQTNWWFAIGVSLIFVILNILSVYFTFLGLGVRLDLLSLGLFVPLLNLLGLIPFPLNGIGVKEGLAVVMLSQLMISPEMTLSVFLGLRVLKIILDVLGIIWAGLHKHIIESLSSFNKHNLS